MLLAVVFYSCFLVASCSETRQWLKKAANTQLVHIRMTKDMHRKIQRDADRHGQTINAEILKRLEASFSEAEKTAGLEKQLETLRQMLETITSMKIKLEGKDDEAGARRRRHLRARREHFPPAYRVGKKRFNQTFTRTRQRREQSSAGFSGRVTRSTRRAGSDYVRRLGQTLD